MKTRGQRRQRVVDVFTSSFPACLWVVSEQRRDEISFSDINDNAESWFQQHCNRIFLYNEFEIRMNRDRKSAADGMLLT